MVCSFFPVFLRPYRKHSHTSQMVYAPFTQRVVMDWFFFFLLLSKFGRLRIWSLPTSCNTFSIGVDLPMIKSKELF